MKKNIFIAMGFLALCAVGSNANATLVTINAFQDAEVLAGTGANYGSSTLLSGNVPSDTSHNDFGLFQFNLASVIPVGATITSAQVELYRKLQTGEHANNNFTQGITIYGLTAAWTQATVTGNNEPGHGAALTSVVTPGSTGGYLTWSGSALTALVQNWYATPGSNFGLTTSDLNYGSGDNKNTILFDSHEAGSAYAPILLINYTVDSHDPHGNPIATPEPASMALFGLGLAGVGLLRRKFNAA